jgi:hypothetical protein
MAPGSFPCLTWFECDNWHDGAVYLALSLPPVEFPTRKTLDYWLPVALVRWPWLRHVMETGTILCISLLLALLFPSSSAKVSLQPHGVSEGNP